MESLLGNDVAYDIEDGDYPTKVLSQHIRQAMQNCFQIICYCTHCNFNEFSISIAHVK